jgi:hypothetical protein
LEDAARFAPRKTCTHAELPGALAQTSSSADRLKSDLDIGNFLHPTHIDEVLAG